MAPTNCRVWPKAGYGCATLPEEHGHKIIKSKGVPSQVKSKTSLTKKGTGCCFVKELTTKSLKLINISRFTNQKDHLTLLKAFQKIHKIINLELLIVGYGENSNKIKSFIKQNKLQNKIKVLNFQKNPYKFIKKSDVFVLTSKFEGLPNILMESLV